MFVRYYSKKQLFARTNGMDSDLMIDKASPITKRPPPNDPDITASVLATKPTEQKLTKDEYIEFGQEVLLLEELKDVDKPKPPAPTDPNSDKSA